MTRFLSGRKASGWGALAALLLFNVICFGLVDTQFYQDSAEPLDSEPIESVTAKRTPKFAKVTEIVLGR